MEYVKWDWSHSFPDEPYRVYAELDDKRWVTRTVELYADGRRGYAWEDGECGAFLAEEPYPPNEDINGTGEFQIASIQKEEFESVWREREKAPQDGSTASGQGR